MKIKSKACIYTTSIIVGWILSMIVAGLLSEVLFVITMFLPVVVGFLILMFMTVYQVIYSLLENKED